MTNSNIQQIMAPIANIIYDEKGVEFIDKILSQTKGGRESDSGVPQAVAMIASTLLLKMRDKIQGLDDEELFGQGGVLHSTLDAIFEVVSKLGYKTKKSDLQAAYELVEESLETNDSPQEEMQEQGQMPPQAAQASPFAGVMQ